MSCDFTQDDGSYVLGALSPADRQAFEEHLAGCAECARSVRELAGLPGLLARVDPDVLDSPPVGDPVPNTLLPSLVRHARRSQRRRMLATAGVAATAAAAIALGAVAVTGAFDDDSPPAAAPSEIRSVPPSQTMSPVGHAAVRGSLAFTSVLWGTKLDLTCSYNDGTEYGAPPPEPHTYVMFIRTRDGHMEQVATWRGLPGKTMRLAAATAANRTDITSVVVRTSGGKPVLKLVA